MPYHPTIPQAGDDPSNSQQDLLDNFGAINTDFSINHVPFTSGTLNGYHSKVYFYKPLSADPNLASPISTLYSKSVSGLTQLFFQNGSLASNVFQLTDIPFTTSGTNWGFNTPWGITFDAGLSDVSVANFITVTFAKPFVNPPFSVLITPTVTSTAPYFVFNITKDDFQIQCGAGSLFFYYFAVGV